MITKEELIKGLEEIRNKEEDPKKPGYYQVDAHIDADDLLLSYINDEEVTEAFEAIDKWYS